MLYISISSRIFVITQQYRLVAEMIIRKYIKKILCNKTLSKCCHIDLALVMTPMQCFTQGTFNVIDH